MEVSLVECKSAISPSRLPGLDWALNPYRGCAHRCRYCYAQDVTRFRLDRPWGDVIEVRVNITSRLKRSLSKSREGVYGVGTVTDPYQPLEGQYELTRGCLSVLKRYGADVSVLTKSDLVTRDLDLLEGWEGAEVGVSVCTIDESVASVIEPGAPSPGRRLSALSRLSEAGVNTYLMLAPLIPGLCDSEPDLIKLLEAAREAHVRRILWDVFNPRPVALSRLRTALRSEGLSTASVEPDEQKKGLVPFLHNECARRGIVLEDAF